MSETSTFRAVDDAYLAEAVSRATARVVYAAPGLGDATAKALVNAIKQAKVSITLILDADADAIRIGYGDPKALDEMHRAAAQLKFPIRRESGIRIGVLIVDDEVVVWSPTARSVEPERVSGQKNAIALGGAAIRGIEAAVGAEGGEVLPSEAEIGKVALKPEQLQKTIEELKVNPPAPFDLARRTRVFSTRFQFVEFEVRGAEWGKKQIKLSSLLLNADLPDSLQDLLDTQVRPFQQEQDADFEVQALVLGRLAFDEDGRELRVRMTQARIVAEWDVIRDRYLHQIRGFGWLIQRKRLDEFSSAVRAYEGVLREWVEAFKEHSAKNEEATVRQIVDAIKGRIGRGPRPTTGGGHLDLESQVRRGLDRLRMTEPRVRIVLKNVSWESSRDEEFLQALRVALSEEELSGWFEEFHAAPEQRQGGPR
jgi:hypothetical protein